MIRLPTIRPDALLVLTFAALIAAGAVLLRLPISHANPAKPVGWIDALFTATSAVCVTGLTSVDTQFDFSRFGHVVILVLIQLGGLGIMTFAAAFFQLFARRLSVGSNAVLQETYFQPEARMDFRVAFRRIVAFTLVIEVVGAIFIFLGLPSAGPAAGGWFEAVFLSISAYCNAGFATWSKNLVDLRDHQLVLWSIMILITLGGIGYTVMFETFDRARTRLLGKRQTPLKWSLNARLVWRVSAFLTFGGAALLLTVGLTPAEQGWGSRMLNALFQSVTARTAGFNTIDIGALPVVSLMILVGLMFIGGSPGS